MMDPLFYCYINDLPSGIYISIPVSDCIQVTLLWNYRTVKDVPDQLKLQIDLNKMTHRAKTWHMYGIQSINM